MPQSGSESSVDQCPPKSPEPKFNLFSIVSFWWLNPLILLGYKRALKQNDLYLLPVGRKTKYSFFIFRKNWIPNVTLSITWPLIKTHFDAILTSALFRLLSSICIFIPPIALDHLLAWIVHRDPYYMGYVYGAIMFSSGLINSILSGQYEYHLSILSMKMRSGICDAIYQKLLRLSPDTRAKYTTGQIVNLMSVDVMKLHNLVLFMNVIWSAGFQVSVALYLLWQQLGLASFAGVGFMLVVIPITTLIAQGMKKGEAELMSKKDDRSKLMNQILSGIKVIKLYGWENALKEQVNTVRKQEKSKLRKLAVFYSSICFLQDTMPILVAVISLTAYSLIDTSNTLTASKAFVSLALFNLIRTPLSQLPFIIQSMTMYTVSSRRINDFLNAEECNPSMVSKKKDTVNAVSIENGSFKWSKDESSPVVLKDINVDFPRGKLVAIIGRVGSGKSSLLSSILGETYKVSGSINVSSSLAYVPQVAWIQNKTLKENILFKSRHLRGRREEIDESRYQEVIKACALELDIAILDAGDETEIGEKGINLSGGQKQRVSLARAVYQDSNIYLLDDPLSAVDSHVGQHIFDQVIGPNGLLKDKTRIMVTHRVSILPSVDLIIVLKDGSISEIGSYQELVNRKGDFSTLMNEYSTQEELDGNESEFHSGGDSIASGDEEDHDMKSEAEEKAGRKEEAKNDRKGKLTETEKEEAGSVSATIYWNYFKSAGIGMCLLVLAMLTASSGFNIGSSYWLSEWAEDGQVVLNGSTSPLLPANDESLRKLRVQVLLPANDESLRKLRIQVYAGLSLSEATILFFSDLILFLSCVGASTKLHDRMLSRILRAPMSFFDTTPIGRILNRFTKDIDGLDVYLAFYIRFSIYSTFKVLITVIVISYQTPFFLLAVVPLCIIFYFLRMYYIPTSRQLKRIESSTKSPVYSHFTESITGSVCIKAFDAQSQFIQEFEERNDTNSTPWLLSIAVTRWNSFRLELIGHFVVFSCVFLPTILGESNAARVGLSVSYALTITSYLNLLIRFSADLESNIVAAERVIEYSEIETEASGRIEGSMVPENWPHEGRIKFESYSTRYRSGLDLILKDVSFEVNPGEKVGIIGRTGAGKSSLTLALFRMIEPASGKIVIDDVDISQIGLLDLRSKLTIIPQDPILFTGSLRMNLDPFGSFSDDVIWSTLDMVHLKTFITKLESGLDHKVSEGGENFSVGQRQLICLTRALLRKSKILILDEATAAVDVETDSLIQKTIQEHFSDCTILTIAHRLNTILDYDRILVLDAGQVSEFDTPPALLDNPTSLFHSLVKKAGLLHKK